MWVVVSEFEVSNLINWRRTATVVVNSTRIRIPLNSKQPYTTLPQGTVLAERISILSTSEFSSLVK